MSLPTFNVSDVIEIIGQQHDLNVSCEGIDDQCFGVVITSQSTFVQFLQRHKDAYNYQIIDGEPIRVVRRAVNDALAIDVVIQQADCIIRSPTDPSIKFTRVDPLSLPRQVEVQYVDPDRVYATNTQNAKHQGARIYNGRSSISIDFIVSADQARTMAYDVLYRLWAQQLSFEFEHRDLRIEPGDVVQLVADQGIYVGLVQESLVTDVSGGIGRINQLKCISLLTSRGAVIPGGQSDGTIPNDANNDTADWIAAA